jgi:hypothetical protein
MVDVNAHQWTSPKEQSIVARVEVEFIYCHYARQNLPSPNKCQKRDEASAQIAVK